MITHELSFSADNTAIAVAHEFAPLTAADRVAMAKFMMGSDELAAGLKDPNVILGRPDHPSLTRPDWGPVMRAVLQASLIGAGMATSDAQVKAFGIVHVGNGSLERARQICLKILTAEG